MGVIDLNLLAPPEDFAFSKHSPVSYAEFVTTQISGSVDNLSTRGILVNVG